MTLFILEIIIIDKLKTKSLIDICNLIWNLEKIEIEIIDDWHCKV